MTDCQHLKHGIKNSSNSFVRQSTGKYTTLDYITSVFSLRNIELVGD